VPQSVFVTGVGIAPFGKFPDVGIHSLGSAVALKALRDAGVAVSAVEAIACGTARTGILQGRESGVGQLVGWELGISQVPVYNLKAYCASGASAFNTAYSLVAGGFHDVILVVGLEKLTDRPGQGRPLTSDGVEIEGDLGFTPAVYYAAAAERHMATYGTTEEHLAMVAVKNRAAGVLNPNAQYRSPVTLQEVLESRRVVGRFHLFDCCPTGDGAAAVVLMSEEARARYAPDVPQVRVDASVVQTGHYDAQPSLLSFALDLTASQRAYLQAGIGPEDVHVAEVHDAFTIGELIHYEDLGFCERGMAGPLVASGETALGGRLPVNPGGGLIARGHPLGATGVAQLIELTQQLRKDAGPRQVEGAKVGLAQVSGGFLAGDFATSAVTILSA
jgi:acetyl-CoA acyltransferase